MNLKCLFFFIFFYLLNTVELHSVQLTFELPDNEVQCFYEHVNKGENTIIEFQVVTGGNYDVDMTMKSPNGKVVYKDQKKQYDSVKHTAQEEGIYEVCFSNEFSTFTHKVVFLDWQVGDEEPLMSPSSPQKALTFMETSAQNIHEKLNEVLDMQTHYRLREFQGRVHADDLNDKVQTWSVAELGVIILIGLIQVTIIRSFFSNRK